MLLFPMSLVPASPKESGGEKDDAEAATADVMEPGCFRERAVKFSTPPQQRQGGHSPTLQELMAEGWSS